MSPLTSIPERLFTLAGVSTAAVALAWLVTLLLRRKSAALRHFFWLLALSAPLLALPLGLMHARIAIPILPHSLELASTDDLASQSEIAPSSSAFNNGDQISAAATHALSTAPVAQHEFVLPFSPWIAVWFFGAVIIIIRILFSQMRVRRLIQNGCSPGPEALMLRLNRTKQHFRLTRPVRLMVTPLTEIPFCHGVFQPTVIFPESWHEWDDERIEVCLTHELAHIIRGDLLAMALAQVTCILCWFNPLVWFAASKLRDEAENSADDLVLARNIRPETYASNLVAITEKYRASALSPTIALSMARPNRLKSRVEAILDSTILRKAPGFRMIFCTGLLAAIALIAGMSVRLTAAPAPADAPTISSNASAPATAAPSTANKQPTANQTAAAHEALDNTLISAARAPSLEFAGQGKIQRENAAKVEQLLQQGADPNAKDKSGNTALIYALNFGNDDVAQALIEHGADFNVGDQYNPNAAWLAASLFYCPKALELMIKKGIDVTSLDKYGGNILNHISRAGPLGPSHPSYFNGVAYSESMQKEYEARERRTVDLLVAAGVDLNGREGSKGFGGAQTPLMAMLQSRHLEAARALIDHGADVTLKDTGGNTALAYIFIFNESPGLPVDLIASMLTRGVDPNSTVIPWGGKAFDAVPVMDFALEAWHPKAPESIDALRKTIGLFLSHGAVFPKISDDKVQALLKAAAEGDLKSMQDIVQQGTSINSTDGSGWTALTVSTVLSFTDCAQWCLSHGANTTLLADKLVSEFALAVESGQADLVDALIAKGPKPNPDATKVLWFAVENKDQRVFDALIRAGADPKGVNILSCIKNGQVAMAKTALNAGADPNHDRKMPNNQNLAFWAVHYNQPEILKALLDHGADPSPKNSQGDTALSHAQKFHPELVPILESHVK